MERVRHVSGATSLFTDLGTGQPPEDGLRICLVAMRLAEAVAARPKVWSRGRVGTR